MPAQGGGSLGPEGSPGPREGAVRGPGPVRPGGADGDAPRSGHRACCGAGGCGGCGQQPAGAPAPPRGDRGALPAGARSRRAELPGASPLGCRESGRRGEPRVEAGG